MNEEYETYKRLVMAVRSRSGRAPGAVMTSPPRVYRRAGRRGHGVADSARSRSATAGTVASRSPSRTSVHRSDWPLDQQRNQTRCELKGSKRPVLEVTVRADKRTSPTCSGCQQPSSGYDTLEQRRYLFRYLFRWSARECRLKRYVLMGNNSNSNL